MRAHRGWCRNRELARGRSGRPRIALAVAASIAINIIASGIGWAQDGGARSPFAEGAGGRALSMGGAYAAVADDATGFLWNPGGLGRVQRLGFEVGQAQYSIDGVSDVYAAAVVPNWRWGAVAASLRQFSVGGIERRDDRNFLLDGKASDAQSELAMGFGRSVSERWNVGGTLKIRHQSLDGFSATGFGADLGLSGYPALALGVQAPWAERLTAGVTLANVARPSLKLDRENVPDPSALRTGFAYAVPLAGMRSILLAFDLEQVSGLGARAHAGMALRILPQFEVTAGMNGSALTAGSEVRWRDVAIDYVFESRDIESTHRLGVRFQTGPTVSATRLAARQREAAKLEAQLEDGFQKRLTDQVQSLVTRASQLEQSGDFDGGADLVASALVLDPGNRTVAALGLTIQNDKAATLEKSGDFPGAALAYGRALVIVPGDSAAAAGLDRCRAEISNRGSRSAEAAKLSAAAFDAFAADDLPAARRGYQQVLDLDSNDTDAAAMLRRTADRIARRTQSLLDQARHLVQTNGLDEAAALIEQVTLLDPRADGLASLRAALQKARDGAARDEQARVAQARAAARASSVAPESPKSTLSSRELDALYRRGVAAMQAHQSDEAVRYWEIVRSADPSYQSVGEYLKREYLSRGMEAFAAGRLAAAVESWSHVLEIDPGNARATAYISRAREQQERTRQILGSER